MFKVLIPSDGSPYSLKAANYAKQFLARYPESEITVLHVSDVPKELLAQGYMLEMTINPQVVKELMDEKTDKVFEETLAVFAGSPFTINKLVQMGNPAEVICDLVDAEQFDLVIMGSRGLGEFKGILLGSVSDRVSHVAKCPVLIVK